MAFENTKENISGLKLPWGWLFALATTLVVGLSLRPTLQWRTRIAEEQLHNELQKKTQIIAENIDLSTAHAIADSPHDRNNMECRRLSRQMKEYSRSLKHEQVWSAVIDGEGKIQLPGCLNITHTYLPPEEKIKAVFNHGNTVIERPSGTSSSLMFTAMAPVFEPQTGKVLMVIGLNYASHEWLAELTREKHAAVLLLLAPLAIIVTGLMAMHFRWRHRQLHEYAFFRYLEAWVLLGLGIWGTLTVALALHDLENRYRYRNYLELASKQARLITSSFHDLKNHQLDSLARFHYSMKSVERKDFRSFSLPMLEQQAIHGIAWIKPVPGEARESYESILREEGFADFIIWEIDDQGQQRPAAERETLYPIWYAEPMDEIHYVLGYDLASEPYRKAALQKAITEKQPAASDPLKLLPGDFQNGKGILLLHPVFRSENEQQSLQGLALIALSLEHYLTVISQGAFPGPQPTAAHLYQIKEGKADKLVADSRQGESRRYDYTTSPESVCLCSNSLETVFPLFSFGNCYLLLIQAEESFLADNPLRQWRLAAFTGGLLSLVLSFATAQTMNRRYRLEQEVQTRTEELTATLYSIGDAVIATDHQRRIQRLNPIAAKLTGWPEDEAKGRPLDEIFKIINEYTRQPAPDPVNRVLKENKVVGLANHTMLISRDGKECPIADSAAPIRDSAGIIIGAVMVFRDQTKERQTERDLRESEARYRYGNRILNAIREINQLIVREKNIEKLLEKTCKILVKHPDYNAALILLMNENNGEKPFYHTSSDMAEGFNPLKDMMTRGELPPCCKKTSASEKVSAFSRREKETICKDCPALQECLQTITLCILLSDGENRLGYMTVYIRQRNKLSKEEIRWFAELGEDITHAVVAIKTTEEKESLEEQLRQAQKMEAVGRLAGGVAHDFNNMLAIIMGNAEMAMMDIDNDKQVRQELETISSTAKRSAELTQQLLAFARKQVIAPTVLELNSKTEDTLKMLKRLIGENINLSWLPYEKPVHVKLDSTQLNQILTNLLVNSRDAIQHTGEIIIEVKTAVFSETCLGTNLEIHPGHYAVLTISDNGQGMDREIISHIFEPFFSTKKGGRGTGLGLPTVYGIVKQNRGFINVYSEPDQGTVFKIYLPREKEEETKEDSRQQENNEQTLAGNETILMVEDEVALLQMGKRMLNQMGYHVLTADDPNQAQRMSKEYDQEIHLLLTDVVLPKMNGWELYKMIAEKRPDVKTLFISGYTANVIAKHGILNKDVAFLEKPFSKKTLGEKVREVLDS